MPATSANPTQNHSLAAALAALAIGFNLPYARLASSFDYPGILREPAEVILDRFAEGGTPLILTWYAFALAAIVFIPVALAHALTPDRITNRPGLAITAAILGTLAGLTQAMGLLRWVMVVPGLAATGDVDGFALIHAYAGVALGEHLGMLLTAAHLGIMGRMQRQEGAKWHALLAGLAALAIALGAAEGVALAIGHESLLFPIASTLGYLGLTLWLLASAWTMARARV